MVTRKGQVLRLAVALGLVGAITASAMIGSAGAGPNTTITVKKLNQRVGARSFYHDAAVAVHNGNIADAGAVEATLPLPKGKFVILGKLVIEDPNSPDVHCRMNAGGDFDEAQFQLVEQAGNGATAPGEVITLTVTHNFASPGTVVLRCNSDTSSTTIEDIKITGMEFPNLRNTPF